MNALYLRCWHLLDTVQSSELFTTTYRFAGSKWTDIARLKLVGGVGWQSAENDVVLKTEFEHGFGFSTIPDFNVNLVQLIGLLYSNGEDCRFNQCPPKLELN
jgi:hypothetical protein